MNGVFLLALCFSIFMEAIERFVNVTEVRNPKLVVVVGSLGLASNIVGLFLFHEHGHSHGGHSHSHGGHSHGEVEAHDHSHTHEVEDSHAPSAQQIPAKGARKASVDGQSHSGPSGSHSHTSGHGHGHAQKDSVTSLYGHPAQTRAHVVQTAQDMGYDRQGKVAIHGGERDRLVSRDESSSSNLGGYGSTSDRDVESGVKRTKNGLLGSKSPSRRDEDDESDDELPSAATAIAHKLPGADRKKSSGGGHGHSHGGGHDGEMNMRGVFLHVLGDALGNVGVIASGLFILLTSYSWRFYTDPLISFAITVIIFTSALPLVKSASFILLQGVPTTVPLETVRDNMLAVEGVLNVHELHIWQLSESKIVASVHVLVDCSDGQEDRYMLIANQVRQCLHAWGIHSSTIQPEFIKGGIKEAARISGVEVADRQTDARGRLITKDGTLVEDELSKGPSTCLLACEDEECAIAACCPPSQTTSAAKQTQPTGNGREGGDDLHDHAHDHEHDH